MRSQARGPAPFLKGLRNLTGLRRSSGGQPVAPALAVSVPPATPESMIRSRRPRWLPSRVPTFFTIDRIVKESALAGRRAGPTGSAGRSTESASLGDPSGGDLNRPSILYRRFRRPYYASAGRLVRPTYAILASRRGDRRPFIFQSYARSLGPVRSIF
jgi:hypothetical protein